MAVNYYELLGIQPDATRAEIKAAFNYHSKAHHPDKHTQASLEDQKRAERYYQQITNAYSVLSDPEKRLEYDTEHRSANNSGASAHSSKNNNTHNPSETYGTKNPYDDPSNYNQEPRYRDGGDNNYFDGYWDYWYEENERQKAEARKRADFAAKEREQEYQKQKDSLVLRLKQWWEYIIKPAKSQPQGATRRLISTLKLYLIAAWPHFTNKAGVKWQDSLPQRSGRFIGRYKKLLLKLFLTGTGVIVFAIFFNWFIAPRPHQTQRRGSPGIPISMVTNDPCASPYIIYYSDDPPPTLSPSRKEWLIAGKQLDRLVLEGFLYNRSKYPIIVNRWRIHYSFTDNSDQYADVANVIKLDPMATTDWKITLNNIPADRVNDTTLKTVKVTFDGVKNGWEFDAKKYNRDNPGSTQVICANTQNN
jgi:curved DNA-binding protein CbpA